MQLSVFPYERAAARAFCSSSMQRLTSRGVAVRSAHFDCKLFSVFCSFAVTVVLLLDPGHAYRTPLRLGPAIAGLRHTLAVTVDRRPQGATIVAAPGMQPMAVLALSAQLTPSERQALQKAISPNYLEDRGLREGSHGEILNERGRTIFEVGFARAVRKVLEC